MSTRSLSFYITVIVLFCASQVNGQYHIASSSVHSTSTAACPTSFFRVWTDAYTSGLNITTFFGDGTSVNDPVLNVGAVGMVSATPNYAASGTYTIKHVLYNGAIPLDSVTKTYKTRFCNYFDIRIFFDANSSCTFDAGDHIVNAALKFRVDSSGIPVDTIDVYGGFYYEAEGPVGTIYTFQLLPGFAGVEVVCPATGLFTDTVKPVNTPAAFKLVGVNSTTVPGFDLFGFSSGRAGIHLYSQELIVGNKYSTPQNVTVTAHLSPKHNVFWFWPTPTTVTGNTVVWDLSNVSVLNGKRISIGGDITSSSSYLPIGDTIQFRYTISPVPGDLDASDNEGSRVDTVKAGFDPNMKEVSPSGNITAGTKLTYTIHFENTGNDTAFNIHVMDTLSDNIDAKSLEVLGSTATMNICMLKDGTHNIVKFDFPEINLLDSSHHGENTGMFVYTVKTKTGLAPGTFINNRGGIYFDVNEVVLTNTVSNMIGFPAEAQVMMAGKEVNIYPNPAKTELFIDNVNNAFATVAVTNILGQQMYSGTLSDTQTKVDIRSLPAGTYFVILKGAAGVRTQQFQKL